MNYTAGTGGELGAESMAALGRFRRRIFVEQLGWNLPSCGEEEEWDQFDTPSTVHVLALHSAAQRPDEIRGCARLLPTTGPYLLADVFPDLLAGKSCPRDRRIWELSRFAALMPEVAGNRSCHPLGSEHAFELLRAAMRAASERQASSLVTVSPLAIERILSHGKFRFRRLGPPMRVGPKWLVAFEIRI